MAPGTWLKRNALILSAGSILIYIAAWAIDPGLSSMRWLGNVLLAISAINLGFWLIMVYLTPKN